MSGRSPRMEIYASQLAFNPPNTCSRLEQRHAAVLAPAENLLQPRERSQFSCSGPEPAGRVWFPRRSRCTLSCARRGVRRLHGRCSLSRWELFAPPRRTPCGPDVAPRSPATPPPALEGATSVSDCGPLLTLLAAGA